MKQNLLLALFAMVFMVWSCSDTKDRKSNEDQTEDTGNKKKTTDDGEESSDEEASSNNQSDPVDVVRTIIKAAKTENYSSLSGLCADDADGDSKDICNLKNLPGRQEEFKEFFGKGKVIGDAEINGNQASVNVDLGDKDETINLTKKGKKWYLSSF